VIIVIHSGVRDGSVEVLFVDLSSRPQLVKDVVAAAWIPVHANRDLDTLLPGKRDVRRLGVEDEIAPGRPDQPGTRSTHLLELALAKSRTVDHGRPARQQSLRLQGRELSERFRITPDTFGEMDNEALRGAPVDAALEASDVQNEGTDTPGGGRQFA